MTLNIERKLPKIGAPSLTDTRLLRAAGDIALLASGLLQSQESPLLAVAMPSTGWGDMPTRLCNTDLDFCSARTRRVHESLFRPVLGAICLASDALYARLRLWGWPGGARGTTCILTDGTGVVLAADAPRVDRQWLIAGTAPGSGVITILPLAADGIWPLLFFDPNAARLH